MQIEVAKTVAARPTSVFATIADIANWPTFFRSVRVIELLTPPPNTRWDAAARNSDHDGSGGHG
jgi:hypothetical protein